MSGVKDAIINRVIEDVRAQIKNAEQGQKHAINESKAHKGAMASRYDTFKEEAQYLASGHAVQLEKLTRILNALMSLKDYPPTIIKGGVCAIVEIENSDDGSRVKYFLLPTGGGGVYQTEEGPVVVINIGTQIAQALTGVIEGDEVEITMKETTKNFFVVSVT